MKIDANMTTNFKGRVRNTTLPLNHSLLPLFEAVVNSIHSIEETEMPLSEGTIDVKILRDTQQDVPCEDFDHQSNQHKEITSFVVTDNGMGFTERNIESFKTLDSDLKISKGGKGIGRVLWLKAFSNVSIVSCFHDLHNVTKKRTFHFNEEMGIYKHELIDLPAKEAIKTTIKLECLLRKYRKPCPKTATKIANSLLEHCLWYYLRDQGGPKITVIDEDHDESILLNDLYKQQILCLVKEEKFVVKGMDFDIKHIKHSSELTNKHELVYCAASRLVKKENIEGKIQGLYGKLKDSNGDFFYIGYLTSPFFDESVKSDRTGFNISEETDELFTDTDISLLDIQKKALSLISTHLHNQLEENHKQGLERVNHFIANKAPRYRSILSRIPKQELNVNPSISDNDLDVKLHKYLYELEEKHLIDGCNIIKKVKNDEFTDYDTLLSEYLKLDDDIKRSNLANYVYHRKTILDIFEQLIIKDNCGKYSRESLVHSLIMPQGLDSNTVDMNECNLWVIDERLVFHNYLSSDISIKNMPITGSSNLKRPDILSLNVYDNPILVSEGKNFPLASIVVIEFKRPMRNDAQQGEEKDPIEQALGYLDRIRKGNVKTAEGRLIPSSENIPGFCYIICDLTPTIVKRCDFIDAMPTSDGMGYFGFHKRYNSYFEISSYDRLLNEAKKRNQAFFDKLNLPVS